MLSLFTFSFFGGGEGFVILYTLNLHDVGFSNPESMNPYVIKTKLCNAIQYNPHLIYQGERGKFHQGDLTRVEKRIQKPILKTDLYNQALEDLPFSCKEKMLWMSDDGCRPSFKDI